MEAKRYFHSAALCMLCCLYPPGAAAQRHGEITSQPCPYSCKSQGIPKADCRDWRKGDTCFIEDLRTPGAAPGAGSFRPPLPPGNSGRPSTPIQQDGWNNQWGGGQRPPGYNPPGQQEPAPDWSGGFGSGVGECEALRAGEVPAPRVNIGKVRSSAGFLSDRVKITGSVEGMCLAEAGYYEEGQKIETIAVRAQRRFQRYEFDVRSRSGRNGEIRVYNTAGQRDIVRIHPEGQYRPPGPRYGTYSRENEDPRYKNGPDRGNNGGYENRRNQPDGWGW